MLSAHFAFHISQRDGGSRGSVALAKHSSTAIRKTRALVGLVPADDNLPFALLLSDRSRRERRSHDKRQM
jgi:hypothetical protein